MKLVEEVPSEKLRGGFYTPDSVVDACLDRLSSLLNGARDIRILEPSAGDGAFIRGMGRLRRNSRVRRGHITCVELVDEEASDCTDALRRHSLSGEVIVDSFFKWAAANRSTFHAVVGNPPFIRYQFVPGSDRALAEWLLAARGHELHGVSNFWIPFVLLSLDLLPPGGAFSLVLPYELLSTMSAGQVRAELVRRFRSLRIDLFPRETFPDILQDILVLSGVRADELGTERSITLSEHTRSGKREWNHVADASGQSWTGFLLSSVEWHAFLEAKDLPSVHPMRELANISVAIVTGANEFFTVDDATLHRYGLDEWARPLLARTSESPGIIFTKRDHTAARERGKKCWLLDFSDGKPNPLLCGAPATYLRIGQAKNLHKRFKCRIREPWYRVPHIQFGSLMMAKRSHQHHRLILNEAGVYTTDTIYRGEMQGQHKGREADLVAAFHNSLTLLSAEIEGRSYGGGVLELIPSEIGRLTVPLVKMRSAIWLLDGVSRHAGGQLDAGDRLVDQTDRILGSRIPGFRQLLPVLAAARKRLRDRRFFG